MSEPFRRRSRETFLENAGAPPWPCAGCGELIFEIGIHADQGHVHHKDGDYKNVVLENLEIRHPRCHMLAHDFFTKTPEHREAISKSLKGRQICLSRKLSAETRSKISASMMGNQNRAGRR